MLSARQRTATIAPIKGYRRHRRCVAKDRRCEFLFSIFRGNLPSAKRLSCSSKVCDCVWAHTGLFCAEMKKKCAVRSLLRVVVRCLVSDRFQGSHLDQLVRDPSFTLLHIFSGTIALLHFNIISSSSSSSDHIMGIPGSSQF